MKERLESAGGGDSLLAAATDLLDSEDGYLLATPELRPQVAKAFGASLTLREYAILHPAPKLDFAPGFAHGFTPPELLAAADGRFEEWIATAQHPDGEPGGWIPAVDDPVRIQPSGGWLPPERTSKPGVLLAGTSLVLRGVWDKTLLFEAPAWTGLKHRLRAPPALVAPRECREE